MTTPIALDLIGPGKVFDFYGWSIMTQDRLRLDDRVVAVECDHNARRARLEAPVDRASIDDSEWLSCVLAARVYVDYVDDNEEAFAGYVIVDVLDSHVWARVGCTWADTVQVCVEFFIPERLRIFFQLPRGTREIALQAYHEQNRALSE